MFEDQNPQPNPPPNLPTEPVDMFADVDKNQTPAVAGAPAAPGMPTPAIPDALSAGLLKKKETKVQAPPPDLSSLTAQTQTYKVSEPIFGKIIYALIIVAIVVGLGGAGWFIYSKYFTGANIQITQTQPVVPESQTVPTEQTPIAQTPVQETSQPVVVPPAPSTTATSNISNVVTSDNILFGNSVDSDKDGLSDAREIQIGTDPHNPDTDGDGLSDGDEVLIWHTDPLNPDTDGDGYPDGQEVKNGYNPLGSGKLFNIPVPTSSANGTTTK